MSDHRVMAKGPLPIVDTKVSIHELPRDAESKAGVGPKLFSIRDVQAYATSALAAVMQEAWGVFTAVETGTDTENSRIYLYKADQLTNQTVQVNRSGTQNTVNFSLIVPLEKLRVRPSPNYQWDIIPEQLNVTDGPPVFVIDLKKRKQVPRDLKAEQADAAADGSAKTKAATAATSQTTKAALDPAQKARLAELEKKIDKQENELHKLYEEFQALGGFDSVQAGAGSGAESEPESE